MLIFKLSIFSKGTEMSLLRNCLKIFGLILLLPYGIVIAAAAIAQVTPALNLNGTVICESNYPMIAGYFSPVCSIGNSAQSANSKVCYDAAAINEAIPDQLSKLASDEGLSTDLVNSLWAKTFSGAPEAIQLCVPNELSANVAIGKVLGLQ
jgi:hypothetical protein